MNIEGMGTIMKQVFNGETGYIEQQGMKQPMPEDMVEKQKTSTMFEELSFSDDTISLESITTIDGNDVYKVKLVNGDDTSYRYYNVENGYLIRTEENRKAGEQEITSVIDFDKYSEVDGVSFPYHFTQKAGPQTIIFNVTNVKLNEGVTAEDFN